MTTKGFKLVRLLKNGDIAPLFIDKKVAFKEGEWLQAEYHPTKGFAERQGFHCCFKPVAPHLSMVLKSGERRIWVEVELKDCTTYNRPESQGGSWVLAQQMRIINRRPDIKTTK